MQMSRRLLYNLAIICVGLVCLGFALVALHLHRPSHVNLPHPRGVTSSLAFVSRDGWSIDPKHLLYYPLDENPATVRKLCPNEVMNEFALCNNTGSAVVISAFTLNVSSSRLKNSFIYRSLTRNLTIPCYNSACTGLRSLNGLYPSPLQRRDYSFHTAEYIPKVLGIHDALVNGYGDVFTPLGLYASATDDMDRETEYTSDNLTTKLIYYNEPVIVAVQHDWGHFYHFFIEGISKMISLVRIIQRQPSIPIIVQKGQTEMYNRYAIIFSSFGIDVNSLKFVELDKHELVHASIVYFPFVIRHGMAPHNSMLIREHVARFMGLPSSTTSVKMKKSMLIYGRNGVPKRQWLGSEQVFDALRHRYGSQYNIRRFDGEETFEDVIRMMHECDVFIGVHGAGISNALFMRENTTFIEVAPLSWPLACFQELISGNGVRTYHYISKGNASEAFTHNHEDVVVEMHDFLDAVYSVLDTL